MSENQTLDSSRKSNDTSSRKQHYNHSRLLLTWLDHPTEIMASLLSRAPATSLSKHLVKDNSVSCFHDIYVNIITKMTDNYRLMIRQTSNKNNKPCYIFTDICYHTTRTWTGVCLFFFFSNFLVSLCYFLLMWRTSESLCSWSMINFPVVFYSEFCLNFPDISVLLCKIYERWNLINELLTKPSKWSFLLYKS